MRKWLKKWLFAEENQMAEEYRPAYDAVSSRGGCIQAFKINNGYVVRVTSTEQIINGDRVPRLHFCKDHQEIADFIVTHSAVDKLIGTQVSAQSMRISDLASQPAFHGTKSNPSY